jgi:nicotinamidase-related amidase
MGALIVEDTEWPIPTFYDRDRVGELWRVHYQQRAVEAKQWAKSQNIRPAQTDTVRVGLLLIDVQNTFCLPEGELFVGGRSGRGAVDDAARLVTFIYRNLGRITTIISSLDTHTTAQIFHPYFWMNRAGEHPEPMTVIDLAALEQGAWQVNPAVVPVNGDLQTLRDYVHHYVAQLTQAGKYPLIIWPYHSMLGGIGHCLVPAVEEACFFHGMARQCQLQYELKGNHPLTEHYSVLQPEVLTDEKGGVIAQPNQQLIQTLLGFDQLIIAGQAKSHCVAWTVADLLTQIQRQDPALAQRVYLLEDCTSTVVIPGGPDFTAAAEERFAQFAAVGMHRVCSEVPMAEWGASRWVSNSRMIE